jgi:hypothetical protein
VRPGDPGPLLGMATENRESATYVARYEDGESVMAVTQYGTALLLEPLHPWIEERISEAVEA